MGAKLSSRRRQNHHQLHDHDHRDQNQPQPYPFSSITTPSSQLSSSSLSNTITDNTNTNSNNSNITPQRNQNPIPFSSYSSINSPPILPPPPPPPSHAFAAHAPYLPPPSPPPNFFPISYNSRTHLMPMNNGWARPRWGPPPPPYVDHNQAKKIKNDINVHKDSIRLIVDEQNLDSHLVSFTFDALVDGSITVSYFAKKELNCTFIPMYPEIYTPTKISFEKGLGQKFCQKSGTGIDLGFFELDQLSIPTPGEDIFPLVICTEACLPSQSLSTMSPQAQITQAVLDWNNGQFQVKVVKQILWIDDICYELREIYGLGNSNVSDFDDKETGKECVICMTEPKDTAVLPCRHLCLCSECAKELWLQSNKCPICRQPIQQLLVIKISEDSDPQ